jgi:hypothetical protein
MKTPIEILILDLEKIKRHLSQKTEIQTIQLIIDTAKSQYLEIEKQQIELAFLMGKHNGIQICQYNSKAKEIEAEQYYNETYKNETT